MDVGRSKTLGKPRSVIIVENNHAPQTISKQTIQTAIQVRMHASVILNVLTINDCGGTRYDNAM